MELRGKGERMKDGKKKWWAAVGKSVSGMQVLSLGINMDLKTCRRFLQKILQKLLFRRFKNPISTGVLCQVC